MNLLEKYREEFAEYDAMERDFIDDALIWDQLNQWANPKLRDVRRVLEKAASQTRLEPEEMAILIQNRDEETIAEMYTLTNRLKREVYGDRIVFFAPLYVSDKCANDCVYCGYRRSNRAIRRKTLTMEELRHQVELMIGEGQKRTVLVYGESPETDIAYICETVRQVYSVKNGGGEIRRANINCACPGMNCANSNRWASGRIRCFRRLITMKPIVNSIRRIPLKGITAGGCTAMTGRWTSVWTMWASGSSLGSMTGGLRRWACCTIRSIWKRNITGSALILSLFPG